MSKEQVAILIRVAVEAERAACAELARTSAPAFEVRKAILARGGQ